MSEATLTEADRSSRSDATARTLALAILWSGAEPERVGEVALLEPGVQVVGRGPQGVSFVRQRPGVLEPRPSLGGPALSRRQLELRVDGERLSVRNVGRTLLLVDGRAAGEATVGVGSTLQLGSQLLIGVVVRPVWIEGPDPTFAFGKPDEDGFVGESPAAWATRAAARFAADSGGHVLVHGPSGTGKELIARGIHRRSARRGGPFVSRNAATLPDSLVDAELFGHARDYPNTGMPERVGLVGAADGGTLFLDEIGEMPMAAQAHLLRVLDAGEYSRLGESRPTTADIRLVAATHRAPGSLREDLRARIRFEIQTPTLDRRREDIPLLVRQLMARAEGASAVARFFPDGDVHRPPLLDPGFVSDLFRAHWSTHVRELDRVLWAAIASSTGPALRGAVPDPEPPQTPVEIPLPDRAAVLDALRASGGVRERAWRALGLSSRHALGRLIRKYRITDEDLREGG